MSAVKVTVQVAVAPEPERVQVPLRVPRPEFPSVTVTVPLGVIAPPGLVSVTVTVHVAEWVPPPDPWATELGEHEIEVAVDLWPTATVAVLELVWWLPSPP
jgi:hypothetical protein